MGSGVWQAETVWSVELRTQRMHTSIVVLAETHGGRPLRKGQKMIRKPNLRGSNMGHGLLLTMHYRCIRSHIIDVPQ